MRNKGERVKETKKHLVIFLPGENQKSCAICRSYSSSRTGTPGYSIYHLPCRRAPFLLKKVLPGQMGGPDVLKGIRNKCKENHICIVSCNYKLLFA